MDVLGAWLPTGAWDACREVGEIRPGTPVVLGVDGSYSGDFAGIVACTISPRPAVDTVALFKPLPGEPVDVLELEQAIRDACARFDVREVVYDPYRFARTESVLSAERLPMVALPQSPQRMAPATAGFYEAVVNRQIVHYGDADLATHLGNAVVKDDAVRGYRITKPSKDSPRKIDLAVCAVMAHSRASFLARERPRPNRVAVFR